MWFFEPQTYTVYRPLSRLSRDVHLDDELVYLGSVFNPRLCREATVYGEEIISKSERYVNRQRISKSILDKMAKI